MKKLYIIRHAKSSWSDLTLDDFDRPLNNRGKRDAPIIGDRLYKRGIKPDLVISSPAKRAKKTAQIIAQKVNYTKSILFNESMYGTDMSTLKQIITLVDDSNNTIFFIGHNTELSTLVYKCVKLEENIPTCGVVEIEFNCDKWKDIDASNAKLISFDYPKNNSLA